MRRFLLCLLMLCMMTPALAEKTCAICGEVSEMCLTDEYGAVYCSGTLASYPESQRQTSYTVREGTSIIGDYAFQSNLWIEEVILPEGVVMIDGSAFSGCTELRHVQLPDSLLIIGGSAFYCCPKLEGVVLPPRLYAIGPFAFADNWQMTTIDIPESVRYIGMEAFCNTGLTEMWLRTIDFEYGYTIFRPDELYYKADPLTIHVSAELLEDEVGNIWHFINDCSEGYNITFVYDVPYFD